MDLQRTYIIAEAGVNHNGSLEYAKQLINVAAEAGADAVKFQTFKAEKLVSKSARKAEYQKKATDQKETQYEMLKKLEMNDEWHFELINHAKECGIDFLSTPFDLDSVDLLVNKFELPRLKISSGELTNSLLLLKIAKAGKPVILSTGMCTLGDIETALGVLAFGYVCHDEKPSSRAFQEAYFSQAGQASLMKNVTLLHCTTEYPAPFHETNLRVMDTLRLAFNLPVGFSDHTEGIAIPVAAVALGARMIEKHFTLDRTLPGPDHRASLEPAELKQMVTSIRQVEAALGGSSKCPTVTEMKNMTVARKSVVASRPIQKGERFTEQNLTVKRPGDGLSPTLYWDLIGEVSDRDYIEDEAVKR